MSLLQSSGFESRFFSRAASGSFSSETPNRTPKRRERESAWHAKHHTNDYNSSRSGLSRRGATGIFGEMIRRIAAFFGSIRALLEAEANRIRAYESAFGSPPFSVRELMLERMIAATVRKSDSGRG
jgi:hypothetical protein